MRSPKVGRPPGHLLAHAEANDHRAAACQRPVDGDGVVDGAEALLPAADLTLGVAPFFVDLKAPLRGDAVPAAGLGFAAAVAARPARSARGLRVKIFVASNTVCGSDHWIIHRNIVELMF
jgi:hypothetical protein